MPTDPTAASPACATAAPGPEGLPNPPAGNPDTRPPADSGSAAPRDAFLDNAKYLGIVLVAVAHAWEPLRGSSRTVVALYLTVYTFHMPLFALVSGCLSRRFDASPRQVGRLVTGVAVPYVVFETAYSLFKRWVEDSPEQPVSLLDPYFLTWYLAALFLWRLTTPLWKVVRWPLPVALTLAALATLSPSVGDELALQRVLQFLPFFVLGLHLRPEQMQRVRHRAVRIVALPVVVCAVTTAYWAAPRMDDAWLFRTAGARELGAPGWYGPVMTLALFGCTLVLCACFLAWVPPRPTWFTALGTGTLYGYLLHGFLMKCAHHWHWYDHAWLHRPLGALTVSLAAAAAVTALCAPPVRRAFRCVVEPGAQRFLRPAPDR